MITVHDHVHAYLMQQSPLSEEGKHGHGIHLIPGCCGLCGEMKGLELKCTNWVRHNYCYKMIYNRQ